MPTTSGIAAIPYPVRADRVDGPGSFALMARRLDDITVTPFSSSTARSNAYTAAARTPIKGALSFVADNNRFDFWDGTTWIPVLPDDASRGIVNFVRVSASWPTDGSYVSEGSMRMDNDTDLTVTCVSGRVYRVSYLVQVVDGGSGTSTTSQGCELTLMYNASTTMPTTTSTAFGSMRAGVMSDDSSTASGTSFYRTWLCPSSGSYSFGCRLNVFNSAGIRFMGDRELSVEDLGKTK